MIDYDYLTWHYFSLLFIFLSRIETFVWPWQYDNLKLFSVRRCSSKLHVAEWYLNCTCFLGTYCTVLYVHVAVLVRLLLKYSTSLTETSEPSITLYMQHKEQLHKSLDMWSRKTLTPVRLPVPTGVTRRSCSPNAIYYYLAQLCPALHCNEN